MSFVSSSMPTTERSEYFTHSASSTLPRLSRVGTPPIAPMDSATCWSVFFVLPESRSRQSGTT